MSAVGQVRAFNRTVTRQVGALEAHFLETPRSLAACRLLFEIGARGQDVVHLRARLGLDSGYLSRLLRGLEREGLVTTRGAPRDARVRRVVLTPPGLRELARLNRKSDAAARALLTRLPGTKQRDLVDAMRTVERLLTASAVEIEPAVLTSPAARYCLEQYFAEIGARFAAGFDPARSPTPASAFAPPRGHFLLAWLHGDPVGCAGLRLGQGYAEVKRMWVSPELRGLGIARRLLERIEALARRHRRPVLRLETNRALPEARRLYRSQGFREVAPFNDEPYAHYWFEKAMRR